ncbi:hypothetical protein FQN50_005437 [Emmonsiellopsis sp. PD_5]|nr:hypothetical protein FQN50_005437 [Emmonsiellopsis sp. PD_5]
MRPSSSFLVSVGLILPFVKRAAAKDEEDLGLNLFTDFTPLLALFGEQFARQFMSQSLSWLDHIVFAMVPLGIVTAVIGAIRVCGPKWARAVIGRARETRAVAEIELMSSTSREVCELFNGKSIVRAMGEPQIKQFLLFPHLYDEMSEGDCGLYTLENPFKAGKIRKEPYRGPIWRLLSRVMRRDTIPSNPEKAEKAGNLRKFFTSMYLAIYRQQPPSSTAESHGDIEAAKSNTVNGTPPSAKVYPVQNGHAKSTRAESQTVRNCSSGYPKASQKQNEFPQVLVRSAPNLQLNQYSENPSTDHNDVWLFGAAAAGIILQVGVLVVAGITVYHGPTRAAVGQKNIYGFALFLSGSIVLVFGMSLCAWVIERSTKEYFWKPNTESNSSAVGAQIPNSELPRLIWLQRKHVVNDQAFDPFVVLGGAKKGILTSSRAPDDKDKADKKIENAEKTVSRVDIVTFVKQLCGDITYFVTMLGALCGMLGFVLQFQGLRGLRWPSSVAQLVAIFAMAVIRAGVRRTLGWTPPFCRTLAECELDWMAIRVVFCKDFREGSKTSVAACVEENCDGVHASHVYRFAILTSAASDDPNNIFIPEFLIKAGSRLRNGELNAASRPDEANPSSQRPSSPLPDKANPSIQKPSSQRTLQVRQRISELTAWKGRASKAAMSLKRAIELFMNEFCTETWGGLDVFTWSFDTKVEYRSSPKKEGTWKEPRDMGSKVILLTVERKDKKWSARYNELDAALSLWMSLLERMWNENHGKLEDEDPVDDSASTGEWISDAGPRWESREYRYRRVLGSKNEMLMRDLAWWVDDMLAYEGSRELSVAATIGFHGLKQEGVSQTPRNIEELSIISRGPLPTILAQHLFTGFMWSISKYLPQDALSSADIEDRDRFIPHRIADSYQFPKLRNRKLLHIVQVSESVGLGTAKDILLCLIPPLSNQLLLPNEEILDLVQHSANELEKGHNWKQAAEIYDAWLDTVISSQKEERYNYAVVIAVIDFLLQATDPFMKGTTEAVMHKGASVVKGIVENIVDKLHSKGLLRLAWRLLLFYKAQHRDSAFKNLIRKELQDEVSKGKTVITLDSKDNLRLLRFSPAHSRACNGGSYDPPSDNEATQADLFGWTPVHYYAAAAKDEDILEDTITRPHHKADRLGRTPCHYAAMSGCTKLLESFLGEQPDQAIEAAIEGRDGMTPLHLAAKSGKLEWVKQLAKSRERLHATDHWGRTPIHIAASEGHHDVVEFLMKEAGDEWKDTPCYSELSLRCAVHLAVLNGHAGIVESLIKQSGIVALGAQDSDKLNPFELALLNGANQSMMETLMKIFHEYFGKDGEHGPDDEAAKGNKILDTNVRYTGDEEGGDIPSLRNRLLRTLFLGVYKPGRPKVPGLLFRLESRSGSNPKIGAQRDPDTGSELYKEYSRELAVNAVTDDGFTALIWAIRDGRLDDIKTLFSHGATLHAMDKANRTPLSWVGKDSGDLDAEKRNVIAVELLKHLQRSEVNTIDHKGGRANKTPLMYAAKHGHAVVVRLLLDHNAKMEIQDSRSQTALVYAIKAGHAWVIKTLLNCGASISATDEEGRTSLHFAKQEEVIRLLLERGADINAESSTMETPILTALREWRQENAQCLYDLGAKVHYKTTDGETPLMIASTRGYTQIVKDICQDANAAYINTRDRVYGLTALALACENNHIDTVTELIRHKEIDPNIPASGYRGYTPLHFAVRSGEIKILEALLERQSIDLAAKDHSGRTPLDTALNRGEKAMFRLLLSDKRVPQKIQDDLLENAMSESDEGLIQTLLKAGADPLSPGAYGQNMLILSASRGQLAIFNKFIDTIQSRTIGSQTVWKDSCGLAYHAAASRGHVSIIQRLINLEINPSQLDKNMWTCLDCAGGSGYSEIGEMIYDEKFFPDYLNNRIPHQTPSGWDSHFITENLAFPDRDVNSQSTVWDIRVVSHSSTDDWLSIRTNYCIPRYKCYYYEIEILQAPESGIIGLGLADDRATRYTMPGWQEGTWGYHGDDGMIFSEGSGGIVPNENDYGSNGKYGRGDVIGFGMNHRYGYAFTTLNGKMKSIAFSGLMGQLYPFIGMDITEEGVGTHIRVVLEESEEHPFRYPGPYDLGYRS